MKFERGESRDNEREENKTRAELKARVGEKFHFYIRLFLKLLAELC